MGRDIKKLIFNGQRATSKQVAEIIRVILKAAGKYGIATEVASPVDGDGWRLIGSAIAFTKGKSVGRPGRDNQFFRSLYEQIADLLTAGGDALFGFEGKEHTAQVESELRELRECRFRYETEDRKELAANADRLRDLREDDGFLPTLFCSPTMELGVDISSMNVVYMRNVPPTPANYAQRSGRAGRSGQGALVVTYCAAQSPHDQYFFADPGAVVHGATGVALKASIADNLDMKAEPKPLLKDYSDQLLRRGPKGCHASRDRRIDRVEA